MRAVVAMRCLLSVVLFLAAHVLCSEVDVDWLLDDIGELSDASGPADASSSRVALRARAARIGTPFVEDCVLSWQVGGALHERASRVFA